jgi:signal transduction histidine kinase
VAWGGDARARYTPGQRFPASDGVIGWVVGQNTTVASPDVLEDARFDFPEPRRSQLAAGGNRAVLAVPLRAKGTLIGVLAVADLPGRAFDDTELGLLQTFADQAGLALENARLYQRAQQAYAELAEAQDRLVRGETLRAMGELASGVAHHLNNLLAVILGRIQLALTREPPPEIARHLTIAERAAQDGGEVIRRMRGFGGAPPEQDLDAIDLNGLAHDIIELTRPRWEDEAHVRGVTITTRLEPGVIPPVRGEIGPLREVLMNLVLNAVDAMPEGGRITLRTWADDGTVHCAVADTGVGMSPEVRQRALEPFFTTKGLKSTGLGLSVNYGILQRFGGELAIDSVEGRGTTITFTLPAANRAVVPATTPVTAPPRRLRVLVVDDEPEVRALLTEMLDAEGHDAVVVAGGAEGLNALAGDGAIDVVLTDLGMPGMTGWDVARAVKSRRPELPVVLITGWGEDPEGRPEDRRAADVIIAKPITPVSLRAALARAAAAG